MTLVAWYWARMGGSNDDDLIMELMDSNLEALEMSDKVCPYCNRPLMKIDHHGEMLVGPSDCS